MRKLKALRQASNLTQKEIADRLDIPTSTYRSYENGKRLPNLIILKEIAVFYNVTVDFLIDLKPKNNYIIPETIENLADAYAFLKSLNILHLCDNARDEKVLTFAKLLHAYIYNFNWK